MPPHMKLRGKEAKYILKKAVDDLLPESIIYRQEAWLSHADSRLAAAGSRKGPD